MASAKKLEYMLALQRGLNEHAIPPSDAYDRRECIMAALTLALSGMSDPEIVARLSIDQTTDYIDRITKIGYDAMLNAVLAKPATTEPPF